MSYKIGSDVISSKPPASKGLGEFMTNKAKVRNDYWTTLPASVRSKIQAGVVDVEINGKMFKTKIDKYGGMYINKEMRESTNISPGTELEINAVAPDKIVIVPKGMTGVPTAPTVAPNAPPAPTVTAEKTVQKKMAEEIDWSKVEMINVPEAKNVPDLIIDSYNYDRYLQQPDKPTLFLTGPPGVGKSVSVYEAAEEMAKLSGRKLVPYTDEEASSLLNDPEAPKKKFLFIDLKLTEIEPQDLMGIPSRKQLGGREVMDYNPPLWAVCLSRIPGILFLDELTNVQRDDVISCLTDRKENSILMFNGTKKLPSEINIGDVLLSYDEVNQRISSTTVIEKFSRNANEVYRIYYNRKVGSPSGSTFKTSMIELTGEHPLYAKRNGETMWIKARDIKVGDILYIYKTVQQSELIKKNNPWLQMTHEERSEAVRRGYKNMTEEEIMKKGENISIGLRNSVRFHEAMMKEEYRKKHSEKMRRINNIIWSSTEYKTKMMPHLKRIAQISAQRRTGKIWEEQFGLERAASMKKRVGNSVRAKLKGKTFEEIHGVEKAAEIKAKIASSVSGDKNPFRNALKNWSDEKRAEFFNRIMNKRNIFPTKLEKHLMKIIDEEKIPLKYVGDGEIWITSEGRHLNPDFINLEQKKVVELYGGIGFLHTLDKIQERTLLYNLAGWKCMTITDEELHKRTEDVKRRLKEFLFPMEMQTIANGVEVIKVEKILGDFTVYNIHNEPFNNFFIGEGKVLTHNSAYKIALEKRVGFTQFHKEAMVIAAGNPPEVSGIARELPAPLVSRMMKMEIATPTVESWADWMNKKYGDAWDRRVIAYLARKEFREDFLKPPKEGLTLENFPTPRSWSRVAVMLPHIRPENAEIVLKGYLGDTTASKFLSFIKTKPPPVEEILKNPQRWNTLSLDTKWLTLVGLSAKFKDDINKQDIGRIDQYIALINTIDKDSAEFIAGLCSMTGKEDLQKMIVLVVKSRGAQGIDKLTKSFTKHTEAKKVIEEMTR